MVATMMVITMRGVVIMMKVQDSLKDLIFHNLKEEGMLMTYCVKPENFLIFLKNGKNNKIAKRV